MTKNAAYYERNVLIMEDRVHVFGAIFGLIVGIFAGNGILYVFNNFEPEELMGWYLCLPWLVAKLPVVITALTGLIAGFKLGFFKGLLGIVIAGVAIFAIGLVCVVITLILNLIGVIVYVGEENPMNWVIVYIVLAVLLGGGGTVAVIIFKD